MSECIKDSGMGATERTLHTMGVEAVKTRPASRKSKVIIRSDIPQYILSGLRKIFEDEIRRTIELQHRDSARFAERMTR